MSKPPAQLGGAVEDSSAIPNPYLGPYRLKQLIQHGGMGSVYLAQREGEYQREVAIKILRHGFINEENPELATILKVVGALGLRLYAAPATAKKAG